MPSIRSPLGALGALMVFLEGIVAAALVPLAGQPALQEKLVGMMIVTVSMVTLGVLLLVGYLAVKRPALLFNPQDLDPSVHFAVYGPGDPLQGARPLPPDVVNFELLFDKSEWQPAPPGDPQGGESDAT